MSSDSSNLSDQVNLVVFKDNYAARTFRIPLAWISRFGILLGLFILITLSSVALALKYYWISSRANPSHVLDLEQEISELKASLKAEKPPGKSPDLPPEASPEKAETLPAAPPQPVSGTPPEPTAILFSAFPAHLKSQLPDPASLPFKVQSPRASWTQRSFKVHFALQYIHEKEGNQQGRIIVLARGPGLFLAYPSEALSPAGSSTLISPEKGESFSVSRFREVNADFGPVQAKGGIQTIEIYIFDKNHQLLVYQSMNPALTQPKGASRREATPTQPAPTSDESAPEATSPTSTQPAGTHGGET